VYFILQIENDNLRLLNQTSSIQFFLYVLAYQNRMFKNTLYFNQFWFHAKILQYIPLLSYESANMSF
jgi:hypothetical protein